MTHRLLLVAAAVLALIAAPLQLRAVTGPEILQVTVTPTEAKLGEPISALVLTTPDVVSVHGHVAMYNFNLAKTRDGEFSGSATVPKWARFFHGLFRVQFTARDAAGAQSQAESTVKI